MGGGGTDYSRVRARTTTRQQAPHQQVFTQETAGELHPSLDPAGVWPYRESRDSDEHPESDAVIWKMDITGSMGGIPKTLATKTMPELMPGLAVVDEHVQVLFGAVGDADDGSTRSLAPWQIGQFETSDKLADENLTRLWLGGSGGSFPYESYDLAFFFAARLTSIDCFEKRGQRGHMFLIGDDNCRDVVCAATVNRLMKREVLDEDLPIGQVIAEAAEKFRIFFLIPDERRADSNGHFPERSRRDGGQRGSLKEHWDGVLGEHGTTIVLKDPEDAAVISALIYGINKGAYTTLDQLGEAVGAHPFNITGSRADRVVNTIKGYAVSQGLTWAHEAEAAV